MQESVLSGAFDQELSYWLQSAQIAIQPLPRNTATEGENTVGSAQTIRSYLEADRTQSLLQDMPKTCGTQVNEILLTALALTMQETTGNQALWIDVESHGREGIASAWSQLG